MTSRQIRPHRVGLTLLNAIVFFSFTLIFTTNSFAEKFKITGRIQFLRDSHIERDYEQDYNYVSGKYESKLKQPYILDMYGARQDVDTLDVSSVFAILNEEFDFSNIPICARINSSNEYRKAVSDKRGSFEIEFSTRNNLDVALSANGGANKTPICDPDDTLKLREDVKGLTYNIPHNEFQVDAEDKPIAARITLYITLDGELYRLQKRVDELFSSLPNLQFTDIVRQTNDLLGDQTSFAIRFPKSRAIIRGSILSIAEKSTLAKADSCFKENNFEFALALYSDLARLLPTSPDSNLYAFKKAVTLRELSEQRKNDSNRAYCDSLITIAGTLPNKSKSIQFLESKRKALIGTNRYWQEIETRIELLKSEIEAEKKAESEEAEINRQRRADLSALKKFKVDLDVALEDFFINPFALKGKYIAIRCIVVNFETPTSAIMESDKRFYADFKVTPPKKFATLNLIVKVKGATTLINAFGTPIKVPYVDVVHILNMPPDN